MIHDESCESSRIVNNTPAIAYRESTSVQTIQLCRRQFVTNCANRVESLTIWHPCYCLPQNEFRSDDSTLQEMNHANRSQIINNLTPQLLPTLKRLPFRWFDSAGDNSWQIILNREAPQANRLSVCCHVLRMSKAHVIIFSWVLVSRGAYQPMWTESSHQVPQANRLKFVVTF